MAEIKSAPRAPAGLFVTFEGPDGCGKTTLSKAFYDILSQQVPRAVWDTNPSDSSVGRLIKKHLKLNDLSPQAFLYLFLADRYEHLKTFVEPALSEGAWVVLDRYMDSTLVYQSNQCGVDIKKLNDWIYQFDWFRRPDRTYVVDIDYTEATRRLSDRAQKSANDMAGEAFYESMRRAYGVLAEQEPERVLILDGRRSIEALVQDVTADLINAGRLSPASATGGAP